MVRTILKLLSLALFLAAFLVAPQLALAQKAKSSPSPSPSASPTPIMINSYELFWPLVAGRTIDDGFSYSLKKIKETVRGWFIFGKVEKADYSVFLAVKRVLEAEKLIKENKYNLVNKTLDDARSQLVIAGENIQGFNKTEKSRAKGKEMVDRVINIWKLAVLLASHESESLTMLRQVADKASSIAQKLQD